MVMTHRTLGGLLFAALLSIQASGQFGVETQVERFQLFSDCRPMLLEIEVAHEARANGLTTAALPLAPRWERRDAAWLWSWTSVSCDEVPALAAPWRGAPGLQSGGPWAGAIPLTGTAPARH